MRPDFDFESLENLGVAHGPECIMVENINHVSLYNCHIFFKVTNVPLNTYFVA